LRAINYKKYFQTKVVMTLRINKITNKIVVLSLLSLALAGCGGGKDSEDSEDADTVKVDSAATNILQVEGALFSIPSPIQTSFLIKQSGANYSKEMLNPSKNQSIYSSNFKKALNLGVYGADLGYVTIYEQTQDAIGYLKVVRQLATDLGVSGAFNETLMKRFETNLGNKDSLLSLVSAAYRASDTYLKNNDRKDVGVLILAGGWVESLYFSINIAKMTKNQDVINRIGEQKNSVDNILKLLQPYYNQTEYTEFIDAIVELGYDFDAVQTKYTYVKPTVDVKNKMTTIHSKTEIVITDDQLKNISDKVQAIRKQIIG